MTRPILHFAHANSYPAGTYRSFFRHLEADYDVRALPMHAHNPRYAVDDGWRSLARELADELAARYPEPVILVGHSLGGALSLMTARAHPERVRCVVLLDSPVIAGWRAAVLWLAKASGRGLKRSPARFSAKRRDRWPDAEAAYLHYAAKPMFAAWPQEVLRDYVAHGVVPCNGGETGVRLRFRRETETAIYETLPHHLGRIARPPFPAPVGFIGGEHSVECRQAGLAATRRLVGRHFAQVPGGHLFPMEHPEAAARAVDRMIRSLLNE